MLSSMFLRRPRRVSRWARGVIVASLAMGVALASEVQTLGCGGTPPPTCGMTYVFTKSGQWDVTVSGGTLDIDTLHYLNIVELPPGNGLCPPGPYSVTMTVELDCTPDPDAGPTVFGPFVLTNGGFTNIPVSIAVPAGPPRVCSLTITADIALADGTRITKVNKQDVCIVEEIGVGVPRLELELLGPSIAPVHPGDQSSSLFRLTNNDPTHAFNGLVTGDLEMVARMPGGTSPFLYAVSDPGPGDNYPIAWGDDLGPGGCIPLPPDPQNVPPQVITRPVSLLPGEFVEFELVARPWGMCADGSCAEGLVVADGSFDDGTGGVACVGIAVQVDASEPPDFLWADSGVTATVLPIGPGALAIDNLGSSGKDGVSIISPPGGFLVGADGQPAQIQPPQVNPMPITDLYGRLEAQLLPLPPGQFNVDSFFDIEYRVEFVADQPDVQVEIVSMQLVAGAPLGFEDTAPLFMGTVHLFNNDFTVDSFFDITYQISMQGLLPGDPLGLPMQISNPQILRPTGECMILTLQATVLDPPPGTVPMDGVRVRQDVRAFGREAPVPACPGDISGPGGVPDGQVDVDDLNAILSVFGTFVGAGHPADLANGDGIVNVDDLNVVLANWGCPN